MQVALRKTPAVDATFIERVAVETIEARLATRWPHAGLVIDDYLYHASGRKNLEKTKLTPARWDLIDVGNSNDQFAIDLFNELISKGGKYDWIELLDFTPLRPFVKLAHKNEKLSNWLNNNVYCYQFVLWSLTKEKPTKRATPELILFESLKLISPYSVRESLI